MDQVARNSAENVDVEAPCHELSVTVKVYMDTNSVADGQHRATGNRFLRLVRQQAQQQPNTQFCVWVDEGLVESDSRTFGDLWGRAALVASFLSKEGVKPGDRVILCFNFGLDFLDSFFGCLRLGATAVPVYPPNPAKLQDALKKLALVAADSGANTCLMDKLVDRLRCATKGWPKLSYKSPTINKKDVPNVAAMEDLLQLDMREDEDLAFLQYTSGSTGEPKGVMLSFGNIFNNMDLANTICPHLVEEGAMNCSWLPQFHDMGLLFCCLYPLARGQRQVFMSPTLFIKQPILWLEAMSRYGCTWTIAPNFAYGLAARKYGEMPKDKQPKLDLSRVQVFGNAAEPVRVETMREFLAAFKDTRLGEHLHLFPCYGLAEHTVAATTVAFRAADDPSLATMSDKSGKFVASGVVAGGAQAHGRQVVDVRIVVDGEEVEEGKVGEIWLRSGSCGQGYWGLEERTSETFKAMLTKPRTPLLELENVNPSSPKHFMRTGDEGFVELDASGERRLFVCGRAKDVIIIRGKNIYPQDVELTAEQAAQGQLRLNCSAAVQSELPDNGGELAAADLVCELKTHRMSEAKLGVLCENIVAQVRGEHSLRIRKLLLIRPRCIPKTTSGKIRRKETGRAVEAGEMERKALYVWEDTSVEAQRAKGPAAVAAAAAAKDKGSPDKAPTEGVEELGAAMTLSEMRRVIAQEVCLAVELDPDSEQSDVESRRLDTLVTDSITLVSLSHRLTVRLGTEVSPMDMISADSVLALAMLLYSKTSSNEQLSSTEIDQSGIPANSFLVCPVEGTDTQQISTEQRPTKNNGSANLKSVSEAGPGALSILFRVLVQIGMICWVLASVYICAVPAVAVMERVTDIEIFPLFLFRFLLEPKASGAAGFQSWGEGNGFAASMFSVPHRPLISNAYLAVPIGLLGAAGSFLLCFSLYVVLLKWIILGRVKSGDYHLYGFFYWRRWLVQRHVQLLSLLLSLVFPDSGPLSLLYILLGARVGWGSDATLHTNADIDFDLVSVGAKATVSGSATLLTGIASGHVMYLRTISIGDRCDVGQSAVLMAGVSLKECTRVRAHSVVTPEAEACAERGSTLEGSPASVDEDAVVFGGSDGVTAFKRLALPLAWLLCLSVQAAVCVLPLVALHELWLQGLTLSGLSLISVAVLDLALYLVSLSLFTLAAKWILLGRSLRSTLIFAYAFTMRLPVLTQR